MAVDAGREIVVGVDGRPATLRAVAWAAREAARCAAPLALVVVGVDEHTVAGRFPPPVHCARAALAQARRIALGTASGVVTDEIVPGPAGPALADRAAAAGLLVLGARTPDGTAGTHGTLAQVLPHARCPVVVVPAAWEADRRHDGEVVVAVDPADRGDPTRAAVRAAADVAVRWRRPLLGVVVMPRGPGSGAATVAGRRVLDEALGALADDEDPPTVHEEVRRGGTVEQLLGLVGPSTGLLVIGRAGGATGPQVLRRARCPVALVPASRQGPTGTPLAGSAAVPARATTWP